MKKISHGGTGARGRRRLTTEGAEGHGGAVFTLFLPPCNSKLSAGQQNSVVDILLLVTAKE